MSRFIKSILVGVMVLGFVSLPFTFGDSVSAVSVIPKACEASGGAGGGGAICDSVGQDELMPMIKTVINMLLTVLGFIAVIMIIIGGIRYATSNGDSNQTKSAKDTILYSVIVLIVAILSFAIVNFVIDNFTGSGGGPAA
jgi:hypothetical protein